MDDSLRRTPTAVRERERVAPAVAAMVESYRARLRRDGYDWGEEIEGGAKTLMQFADRCDPGRWNEAFRAWKATGEVRDPVATVLGAIADPLPTGVAVLRGDRLEIRSPLPFALPNRPFRYDVLVAGENGARARLLEVVVTAEQPELEVEGRRAEAVEPAAAARLRLVADAVSRWSVVDERGGAWFPDGALPKFDGRSRPYFYGEEVVLEVPAGRVEVTVARGCEFEPASAVVDARADEETRVELRPERLYDAAARGWYGADLHVHMNYTGDLVWTPEETALAQRGEGLHLLNVVAANYATDLVYDRELLEAYAGRALPTSSENALACVGIEFRNDLLGHFHAFGLTAPPTRYATGHPRSQDPHDWPPNAVPAQELRRLGATIGYTHPVMTAMPPGSPPGDVLALRRARSYEARELVADTALGLVDSLDLMVGDLAGTAHLYHRLLGCGLRLAATAGTDVMLSRTRGRLTSNPPGWCRAYADLGGEPLSIEAWQDAVRAGRTFATNGPWLELDVAGCGPGATVSAIAGESLALVARAVGPGMERLEVVGPEGPVATVSSTELSAEVVVTEPTWLAAVAHGGEHPLSSDGRPEVYAHTSPVWVEVDGRAVARAADAAWCLDWLDGVEELARAAGSFASPAQLDDLLAVLDRARAFYRGIVEAAA